MTVVGVGAVEADWPDAARIGDYVRQQAPRPRRGDVFARFPTWMWRNQEVREFADWLLMDRDNNSVALEVSGIDTVDVGKHRLRQKVEQVRQSRNVDIRAACVVELRPPRSRLATA